MQKTEVLKYFDGSQVKAAAFLSISQPAVQKWPEIIPEKQAARLDFLTKGEAKNGITLVYDPDLYLSKLSA